ncbi:fructose-bisphosphate aldolase [Patescibacteria group bacterium]|nr:fructose-bisphosphate aldolase [Patescibacteria group bacterium]
MTISDIAKKLLKDRKGILSFDQTNEELSVEFARHGISGASEMQSAYRELVFTTENFESYVSGVTLSDEALRDTHPSFGMFAGYLASKNILVGVEVGTNASDADVLSALPARLTEYHALGVQFAEWRMPVNALVTPASEMTKESLRARIEFVKLCQTKNILPVVEIDVTSEGAHSAAQAEDVISELLSLLSDLLESDGIDRKGVVVKTAMAVSGMSATVRADAREVAERTVRAITGSLPDTLGGVVFLSGLQSPEEAVQNLNWIARSEPFSWPISFSFTNALLAPVLSVWQGKEDNKSDAQSVLLERLSLAQSADAGGYAAGMEESSLEKL